MLGIKTNLEPLETTNVIVAPLAALTTPEGVCETTAPAATVSLKANELSTLNPAWVNSFCA